MSIRIEISTDVDTIADMVDSLRYIADLIEQGYTSGYAPDWNLSGIENPKTQ